jgi:SOS-response transcriptional repressor LexA
MTTATKNRGGSRESILAAIADFKAEKGYAPTVRELAALTQYSVSAVQHTLNILERDGVITRDRNSPRTIVIVG